MSDTGYDAGYDEGYSAGYRDADVDEAEARGYAAGVEAAAKRVRELHMAPPTEHPETCACPWCIQLRDIAEEVLVLLKSLSSPAPTTNSVEIGSKLVDEPAPSLLDEARQEAARSTFVCPCPGCMNPATYGKDGWREHVVQHMEEREKAEKERDEAIASCAAMRTILGKLCAAMEGLRPFPLVLNAVADGLIADGRAALAALDSKEQQQDEC